MKSGNRKIYICADFYPMMKRKLCKNSFIVSICLLLAACNLTKRVPQGKYLLTGNIFKENGKRRYFSNLNEYVQLRPNKTFGFLPLGLMFYNISNPKLENVFDNLYNNIPEALRKKDESKLLDSLLQEYGLGQYAGKSLWWDKFVFRNSNKPILIDSALVEASSKAIETAYFSKGFFDVRTKTTLDLKDKKGKVIYNTQRGQVYTLGDIQYRFKESELEKIYLQYKKESEVKIGKIYNTKDFEKELNRMKNIYENYGYYNFNYSKDEVEFEIDSTFSKHKAQVIMHVKEKSLAKKDDDSIKTAPHLPYHFNQIKIIIQNELHKASEALSYKGYDMILPGTLKYKPDAISRALVIEPKGLYKLQDVLIARDNLYNLKNFNIGAFSIKESEESTQQNPALDVNIELNPNKKYELQLSFEGNFSRTNNLGITPGIALLTRNIFGGAENLELSLKGNLASMKKTSAKNQDYFNSLEAAAQAKLSFPRFLLPLNSEFIVPKNYSPHSWILINLTRQKNIGIGRMNILGRIEYEWKSSANYRHRFSLLNAEFIQNLEKKYYFDFYDNDKAIKNRYDLEKENDNLSDQTRIEYERMQSRQRRITSDYLIHSLSYNYEYGNDGNKYIIHPIFFSGKIETGGNLLTWLKKRFSLKKINTNGEQAYTLFKVPYSQFVKVDLEFRKHWQLAPAQTLASRIFLGVAVPYGNSRELPFDRSYFAGGSNDVRAWRAYELGPGGTHDDSRDLAFSDFKITMNAEYRLNIFSKIYGAFFLDAGNIWSLKEEGSNVNSTVDPGRFRWNSFYKQLALGAGLGLRYDLRFVIARLDFAYKLRDPSDSEENRWVFNKLNLLNPVINFGISYPF
ncbi:BamA/TamA family outer membrane protein [Bacteroidetes bacterium endosymbiont of Geopemphigus sp.]|uniref:translocation and assembly module lipoprotein TamL n=1 Tax=Bacteroidetes bacterium endosymbiont of Geopemphigus sp. TaxID=2047937 RepID=UPI000CD0D935|nr:BamA/TamA family outer membrane protein [Bacteroidetes bacterium endosymbiont of Geopemphigus sp.]